MKFFLLFLFSVTSALANVDVDRLKEIVLINSGSANIEGVRKVQETVKPWFEELGFQVELKKNPLDEKRSGPMLVAHLKGKSSKTITFVMHADTVFEPSSPFQTITMKTEHIMQGPGVIDDKGGIIVTLKVLKQYLEKNKLPKYSLRVVITPNEELGAEGFSQTFEEFSQASWLVLGLEPAYDKRGIVMGRKGNLWYEIEVQGKEAHAGRDHARGVNACQILASKIDKIKNLTDYKKGTTVSIGRIEGGQDKFNIVCGWAKAKLDVRFTNLKAKEEIAKKIEKILKSEGVSFKLVDYTAAYMMNKASKPFIEKYLDVIKQVEGTRPHAYLTGGVGDTNHFSREGVVIIDGLGPIGEGLHTAEETIDLRSLETRSQVLTNYLLGL
jgi:glutamate carboxypeptidase